MSYSPPPLLPDAIFARLQAQNPVPQGELVYHSPFQLLIAVILSAQATDKSVNLATSVLFPVAGTPEALLALGEEGLIPYIQKIGLFRSKARHIIETCRLLLERHQGTVPAQREALEALPGVGRKTASVVLNIAFGEPIIAVDTHVFRVANRTGLVSAQTVLETERQLMRCVPTAYLLHAHHWLILQGRYVCQARQPRCGQCCLVDVCLKRQS